MADQLLRQIALVSESSAVPQDLVSRIAAALQKQVTRDLESLWKITATVDAFARLEDVPLGTWPIVIQDDIGYNARGIHLDNDGQPFALVEADTSEDVTSLTSSHECLEMLVDPYGKRMVAGDSPKPDQGRVMFLVEVCDPSEAAAYAYTVNGVLVSDFYTPQFFDPVAASGVRYSFTGAIKEPRQVLQGGYLSWMLPESRVWWQEVWFGTPESHFVEAGIMDGACSLRTELDRLTENGRVQAMLAGRYGATLAGSRFGAVSAATGARARDLRSAIERVKGEAKLTRADDGNDGSGRGIAPGPHRRSAPRL